MRDGEEESDGDEQPVRPSRSKKRCVVEEEENDEGDDESDSDREVAAVRVTSESWPTNVKQNHPQRLFRILLNTGQVVSIVAEDLYNPERGTSEANPFYEGVIQTWCDAGNVPPPRKRKDTQTPEPRAARRGKARNASTFGSTLYMY
jgi:hypothetical protein